MKLYIFLFLLSFCYSFFVKSNLLLTLTFLFSTTLIYFSIKSKDLKKVIMTMGKGTEKSYPLVIIFSLLGILSSSWILGGTIPTLIYYGVKIINIEYLYVSVFIIMSMFSFLLGSSFGSVGTLGLVLLSLSKGLGMNSVITSGAIISGAYFGDRSSPTSSSANFVATLTNTNIYTNIKNMFKTGIVPYVLTAIVYTLLNTNQKVGSYSYGLINSIPNYFKLDPMITLIPLIILLVLCLFRMSIRKIILVSSVVSLLITFFYQGAEVEKVIKSLFFGFKFDSSHELFNIIKGGGVISMGTAVVMAFLSCGIVSVFDEFGILKRISDKIGKVESEWKLFLYTAVTAIFTAGIGASQSTSILLTSQLMKKTYETNNRANEELAINIENTSAVMSGLLPWNIAVAVPAAMLGLEAKTIIPWACYLYIVPTTVLISKILFKPKKVVRPQQS